MDDPSNEELIQQLEEELLEQQRLEEERRRILEETLELEKEFEVRMSCGILRWPLAFCLLLLCFDYGIAENNTNETKNATEPMTHIHFYITAGINNENNAVCGNAASSDHYLNQDGTGLFFVDSETNEVVKIIMDDDKPNNDFLQVGWGWPISAFMKKSTVENIIDKKIKMFVVTFVRSSHMQNDNRIMYNDRGMMYWKQSVFDDDKDWRYAGSPLFFEKVSIKYTFKKSKANERMISDDFDKTLYKFVAKKEDCDNPRLWIANHGIYRFLIEEESPEKMPEWENMYYVPNIGDIWE